MNKLPANFKELIDRLNKEKRVTDYIDIVSNQNKIK